MSSTIPLPTGSYVTQDPRASCKRLVGCFAENLDQDAPNDAKTIPPITLRRMAGINTLYSFGTGQPVRGMWEMAGVQYAVVGTQLWQISFNASLQIVTSATLLGSGILGSGFVRMTDNGACLVILVPGTNMCWTYTANNGFNQLTSTFFTSQGAIDCGFIDSYIVFLALNGTTFFNDDGRVVSGSGPITFTSASQFSREFGTDLFVAMAIDHREVMFFGTRTTEGYINAGNPTGSPFSSAPDSYMPIGVHPQAAYSVALQDQTIIFVANDKTVRRRNGQTPMKISNPGIDQILATSNLTGCYALTPTVAGHPLWVLTLPNANRTICYDCATTKWFELESMTIGYWRPLSYYNGFGLQLVGDSQSDKIGFLDLNTFAEFGQTQKCYFITQSVYDMHNRINHRRLELTVTMGGSLNSSTIPIVDLLISDDSAHTFYSFMDPQNLGGQSEFDNRAVWWNLGQSRDRVYLFRVTDPTPVFTVAIQALLEGGKW